MLMDDAHVGPAPRWDLAGAFDPGRERVARPYRLQPSDLVEAGRAQRRAPVEVVVDKQSHQLGVDVPTRRDQAAEHRFAGRHGVDMKALRIELAGEGHDLL